MNFEHLFFCLSLSYVQRSEKSTHTKHETRFLIHALNALRGRKFITRKKNDRKKDTKNNLHGRWWNNIPGNQFERYRNSFIRGILFLMYAYFRYLCRLHCFFFSYVLSIYIRPLEFCVLFVVYNMYTSVSSSSIQWVRGLFFNSIMLLIVKLNKTPVFLQKTTINNIKMKRSTYFNVVTCAW